MKSLDGSAARGRDPQIARERPGRSSRQTGMLAEGSLSRQPTAAAAGPPSAQVAQTEDTKMSTVGEQRCDMVTYSYGTGGGQDGHPILAFLHIST